MVPGDNVKDKKDAAGIAAILPAGLKYIIVGILALMSGMYFFVFALNWEGWFFGNKLDGLPAGMYLLTEALVAALLVVLIIRYPRYALAEAVAAFLFLAFTFLDSSATIERNSYGRMHYSTTFALFLGLSLVYLAACIISVHRKNPTEA